VFIHINVSFVFSFKKLKTAFTHHFPTPAVAFPIQWVIRLSPSPHLLPIGK